MRLFTPCLPPCLRGGLPPLSTPCLPPVYGLFCLPPLYPPGGKQPLGGALTPSRLGAAKQSKIIVWRCANG
jgi:hypothetical protein